MDNEEICSSIMEMDPRIRFAGVVSENGRLMAGGMKKGIKSLEDTKDDEILYLELVLRAKMRREFDNILGPVQFAMSYREKVTILSFPLDGGILLVSSEKGIDFSDLAFKILKMINQ